jgi:hypothetical protein
MDMMHHHLVVLLFVVGVGHGEGGRFAVVARWHGIVLANIRSTIGEQAMQ